LFEVYNIGTPFEVSIRQICELLIKIIKGPDADPADWIECVEDRAFNDCRYAIDTDKLRALGWEPDTDFPKLLRETVEWYNTHLDWWSMDLVRSYLDPYPLAYKAKNQDLPH
jgi:dTDP-D-glucose 4,6-dehydratase